MQLQADKRYITRDGRKTGLLTQCKNSDRLKGTVDGEIGVHKWCLDGYYYKNNRQSRFDLVLEVPEMITKQSVLEWINLRINDLEEFNKLASFPEAMSNDACITELKALKAKVESL